MSTRSNPLDEKLRGIDPLGAEALDRLDESAGAEALLAKILASDPGGALRGESPRPARTGRRRGRLLVASAIGAVVAAAVVIGVPGGNSGGRGTLPALARVAEAAAEQPAPDTALPYLFTKTRATYVDGSEANGQAWSNYQPEVDEEWVAADGSGRLRRAEGPVRFVGPQDREAWEAADRINFLAHGFGEHVEEREFPAGHFDEELPGGGGSISELPTEPDALAEWLEQRAGDPKFGGGAFPLSVKTLELVAEILQNPLATPELRAALYEAEGRIPGVEYLGPASDEIGRRGVAVGASSANSGAPTLYSLIFDPTTSQVLATEQTITKPPAHSALPEEKTPLVIGSKVFVSSGRTASLTEQP